MADEIQISASMAGHSIRQQVVAVRLARGRAGNRKNAVAKAYPAL